MTTTSTLRSWWGPACTGPFTKVTLHGDGAVTVRSSVTPAVHALNRCLERHDYRTRAADTGGYNCRRITGGTGYSLHAYGTAIDVNWQTNPYGPTLVTDMDPAMIADIKALRTRNGKQVWRWGGDYSGNRDAMHFEIVCHPDDLATGIDSATLPAATSAPTTSPPGGFLMALTDQQQQEVYDAVTRMTPILVRKAGTTYHDTVCLLFRATGQMVSLDKGSWDASKPAIDFFKMNLAQPSVISLPAVQYATYRIVG